VASAGRIRRLVARAWVAAAVLCIGLAAAGAAPAPAEQPKVDQWPLVGINSWQLLDTDAEVQPLRDTPIGSYRAVFSWRAVEPQAGGGYDFGVPDNLVAVTARAHLQLLPALIESPSWVTGDQARPTEPPEPGYEMERFELFTAAVARRYGHGGDFWREHPELPYLPLIAWEVWNEPNYPSFWFPGRTPKPSEYRALLAAAERGLHSGDRQARVLFGGLSYGESGVPPEQYLGRFLRLPGARCLFDDLSIHPYTRSPGTSLDAIHRIRTILDRAGRRDAGLWLTEYGWNTGPSPRFHASEAGQRRNLLQLTLRVLRQRRGLRLRGIYWFALRDEPSPPNDPSWWGWHTGLLRPDGSAKPAFDAYLRLARRAPDASATTNPRCSPANTRPVRR
jgi:polysaccharide biosynthesis protein PslG